MLRALNAELAGWHESDEPPAQPVTLVVGPPRSGTTLTYQLLAATGRFAYPSNLVARFWQAPALGARIAAVLAPLLPEPDSAFRSELGRTRGWWGAHEFSFFWREQLQFGEDHGELSIQPTLAGRIGALEREVGHPVLMKSNLLCFAVPALAAALPTARFVWVHRDPVDTGLSILAMRERTSGDRKVWWSTRPPGVDPDASPHDQVAWQVHRCNEALRTAAASLGERMVRVEYDALCADVHTVLAPLVPGGAVSGLPERFPVSRRESPDRAAMAAALERLA